MLLGEPDRCCTGLQTAARTLPGWPVLNLLGKMALLLLTLLPLPLGMLKPLRCVLSPCGALFAGGATGSGLCAAAYLSSRLLAASLLLIACC